MKLIVPILAMFTIPLAAEAVMNRDLSIVQLKEPAAPTYPEPGIYVVDEAPQKRPQVAKSRPSVVLQYHPLWIRDARRCVESWACEIYDDALSCIQRCEAYLSLHWHRWRDHCPYPMECCHYIHSLAR